MMLAIAKIDFAACLDSFMIVSGGPTWSSLSLFALSLSCFKCSLPCCRELKGRLSLQTATMLTTIVMICDALAEGGWRSWTADPVDDVLDCHHDRARLSVEARLEDKK